MKKIAKVVFKIHRLIYKYPCRSEVRLALDNYFHFGGLTYYVGMMYICEESLESIANCLYISKDEVKFHLNKVSRGVVL